MTRALELRFAIRLPYSRDLVIEQFFDFEHIPQVHPRTLGQVDLVTLGRHWVIGDMHWPLFPGIRVRSRLRGEFHAPDRITADIIEGWGRGSRYEVVFRSIGAETQVDELIVVPGWRGWLAGRFRGRIERKWQQVWDEDLKVRMPHGGWPGLQALGITETDLRIG